MLPNYAPRATPFRSSQIRKHLALRLESSVIKNTQITERFHIQFRAEAFNLFNPNFGTVFPALVFKQNTFPRQLQPGIRA